MYICVYVSVCARVDILNNRSCGSEEGDWWYLPVLCHGRRGLFLHPDAAGRVAVCFSKTDCCSATAFTPCLCSRSGESHKRPPLFWQINVFFRWKGFSYLLQRCCWIIDLWGMAKTRFSQITNILNYVIGKLRWYSGFHKNTPCVCVSPGLCLLQVWRAADPQVTAARLPRHAGPRDRLVWWSQKQPRSSDHTSSNWCLTSSRSELPPQYEKMMILKSHSVPFSVLKWYILYNYYNGILTSDWMVKFNPWRELTHFTTSWVK